MTAPALELQAVREKGYAHPEALVTTEWLAARLGDPSIRIVEQHIIGGHVVEKYLHRAPPGDNKKESRR